MARTLYTSNGTAQFATSLTLTVSDNTITLELGSFVIDDEVQYTISEDEDFIVMFNPTNNVQLMGYIVLDDTDTPHLFVEETVEGVISIPYEFTRGSSWKMLHMLFNMTIPAGAASLTEADYFEWERPNG